MTSEEVIARFLTYLRAERGVSQNTIYNYTFDLNRFAGWLNKELTNATRQDVQLYLSGLIASGKSGRTARRHLCCLRTFYKFVLDESLIERDPTRNLPGPRVWKKLPRSISREDVEKMVASLSRSPLDIRDKAILLTFYGSGLRESELAALKVQDVDLETGIVKVWNGKGGKDAILPLSALSIAAIKQYLRKVRPLLAKRGGNTSENLFLGFRYGTPLTRQEVFYRVRDHAKSAD